METAKLYTISGHLWGESQDSSHKETVMWKAIARHDVIMNLMWQCRYNI